MNTVFAGDRPVAFIDWEYAAPAPPVWDLACAVWSFAPLADDRWCAGHGYPVVPRGPRLRIFCDAYGLDGEDRAGLLEVVRARELAIYETVRRGAAAGNPRFALAWEQTRGRRWLDAIDYLDRMRSEWQQHLN